MKQRKVPGSLVLAALGLALVAASACGSIFPRYRTVTRVPPPGLVEGGGLHAPPDNVRRVTFVSALLPPSRSDGNTWDEGSGPDLYAVLMRDGDEVYRTPVVRDALNPEWRDASVTVALTTHSHVRIELRDDDGALSELVSATEFTGFPPDVAEGGSTTLRMDRGVELRLRTEAPTPLLGMGVEYEIHETYLRILAIEAASPASGAGLRVDDHVLAVDGRAVGDLGEVGARQAMDRSAVRPVSLTVQRDGRPMFVVDVRVDAVYPAR